MKKFAVLFALLALLLCIVPCYAEDTAAAAGDMLLVAPAPSAPVAPDEPLPEQEGDLTIGEAFVGSDAPIAPSPDTPIEHPTAPDAGAAFEGEDILLIAPAPGEVATDGDLTVDLEAPAVDTTVGEIVTDGALEAEDDTFKFEPASFVTNLRYMAVGMVGIFIVIGLIVLATVLLNRIFRDKAQKSE